MTATQSVLNPAFEKTLGYNGDEILAVPFLDFVHPEDRSAMIARMEEVFNGIPTLYFQQRCRCKDGSYKWLAWTVNPIVEEELMYSSAKDITEKLKIDEALRESEEKYRNIVVG